MGTIAVALGVVFLAEVGDKTQLVALSLAARYSLGVVLGGIAAAFVLTQGFAAVVGGLLGAALPATAVGIGAAVVFIGFAVWTWFDVDEDDDAVAVRGAGGWRAFAGVAVAMTLAELGDKTMLATTTLAADRDPWLTWVGAVGGATLAAGLGVVVGRALGTRLPVRATKRIAAVLFATFGLLLLVDALR